MIISNTHRFIFFAVPKTGTHSIRRALRPQLGDDDHEQVALFERKKLPFKETRHIEHGHLSARQIRPVLGEDIFQAYFKFAFVRDPFDRFVSYCAFMSREDGAFKRDPMAFMKHVIRVIRPYRHLLFRPQFEFLCDDHGQPVMDFVGRVECMQDDFDAICDRLGLQQTSLGKANTSERGDYRQYYDDELVEMVGRLYRRDLELFGYPADPRSDEQAG